MSHPLRVGSGLAGMLPRDDTGGIQIVQEHEEAWAGSRGRHGEAWQGDDGRSHLLSTLAGGREDLDPNEPCPQEPTYCTGCSTYRWAMAPMSLLVVSPRCRGHEQDARVRLAS